MQRSVVAKTSPAEREQFAQDVEYYLSLTPRQLPSRYLYDELGSALFEAICRLPWYHITRDEQWILSAHAGDILAHAQPVSTFVELGPGSGEKLATLVKAAHSHRQVTVHLVDISPSALEAARRALGIHPEFVVISHQGSYEAGLVEVNREKRTSGRTLALFLGSNIANYDPPGADAFLQNIRDALMSGDALLLGTDLVRPEHDLLLAYDDPLGVTAAFNRNLLVRANRELGANFDMGSFRHRAVWNAEASRIEMHLVSTRQQRVQVPASHLDIKFEAGETIWTESSYKYQPNGVVEMLNRAGFEITQRWVKNNFQLALARAKDDAHQLMRRI